MIDRNVALAKLQELDRRIRRVQEVRKQASAEYEADETASELTAFNLMLGVQASLDLALHTIADEEWAAAGSGAEALGRLAEHGVISAELARSLGRAVGFRNAVAHGYAQLRVDLLHDAATRGLADLGAFAQSFSQWLANRP